MRFAWEVSSDWCHSVDCAANVFLSLIVIGWRPSDKRGCVCVKEDRSDESSESYNFQNFQIFQIFQIFQNRQNLQNPEPPEFQDFRILLKSRFRGETQDSEDQFRIRFSIRKQDTVIRNQWRNGEKFQLSYKEFSSCLQWRAYLLYDDCVLYFRFSWLETSSSRWKRAERRAQWWKRKRKATESHNLWKW